ncbi:MAG: S41 family peptidase [Fimbriimonadales bacterium]
MRVRAGFLVWGCLLSLLVSCAQSARLSEAQRLEIFQFVWNEVKEAHYDPNLGGVDWVAVREQYEPKVRSASSDAEFYRLLEAMLGELKQSHFAIIPPGVYSAQERASRSGTLGSNTGLVVQLVDGRCVVVRVRPGSSAAKLGVPPGAEILAVDDTTAEQVLEAVRRRNLSPIEERFEVALSFVSLLSGSEGAKRTVRYRNLDGVEQTVVLECTALRAKVAQFGWLPPIPVYVESRRLPPNIGYIHFNAFMPEVMQDLPQRLRELDQTDGLIIDLRGNIGGVGLMAGGIGGYLVSKETPMGTMLLRQGSFGIVANPQPYRYTRPVVILVDEFSLSTAEIMARGLQEAGRAIIVGRPTPGKALPSRLAPLPHGGYLQLVMADFVTPKKYRIEGTGVKPDYEVELTREAFRTSADPILQKAVELLVQNNRSQGTL